MHGFDTFYRLSNRPVKDQSASLKFKKSVTDPDREFLVTLRIINKNGEIVGYANGGRLENYTLRRGTHDKNLGKRNTAYIEFIYVKPG